MNTSSYSFGQFVLIPERQLLLREDIPIRLGNRALDLLTLFVQRPGELIDKRELVATVWADTFVDESNLKVHIAALRKAIDVDGAGRSCIATVVGRGYRFVENVRLADLITSENLSIHFPARVPSLGESTAELFTGAQNFEEIIDNIKARSNTLLQEELLLLLRRCERQIQGIADLTRTLLEKCPEQTSLIAKDSAVYAAHQTVPIPRALQ